MARDWPPKRNYLDGLGYFRAIERWEYESFQIQHTTCAVENDRRRMEARLFELENTVRDLEEEPKWDEDRVNNVERELGEVRDRVDNLDD